jgi:hypothetical protein
MGAVCELGLIIREIMGPPRFRDSICPPPLFSVAGAPANIFGSRLLLLLLLLKVMSVTLTPRAAAIHS